MATYVFAFDGWDAYSAQGWYLYSAGGSAFSSHSPSGDAHILRFLVGAGVVPAGSFAGRRVFAGDTTAQVVAAPMSVPSDAIVVSYYSEDPMQQGVPQALHFAALQGLNAPDPNLNNRLHTIVSVGFSFGGDAAWEFAKTLPVIPPRSFRCSLGFTLEPRPRRDRLLGVNTNVASWHGDVTPPAPVWQNIYRTKFFMTGNALPGATNLAVADLVHEGVTTNPQYQSQFAQAVQLIPPLMNP